MPTLTTHTGPANAPAPTLLVALDLATPRGAWRAREGWRSHFALPADASIVLCYEAGRDGFWLQRACTAAGITALVVDSSRIEVPRRARRAKTDRLDATALLRLLFRHVAGERGQWRVLHVPTIEEEDRRHAHRELARLTRERTRGVNQIKGLLASHGIRLTMLRAVPDQLPHVTQWDGQRRGRA